MSSAQRLIRNRYVASLSIFLAALSIVIGAQLMISRQGGRLLEDLLTRRAHAQVRIAPLRTNFLGTFTSKEISFSSPAAIVIKNVSIKPRLPARLIFQGDGGDWGIIRGQLSLDLFPSFPTLSWYLQAASSGVNAARVAAPLSSRVSILSRLQGSANIGVWVTPAGWHVDVISDKLKLVRGAGDRLLPINTNIRVSSTTVSIVSLVIDGKTSVTGDVRSLLNNPTLNLSVRAKNATLSSLLALIGDKPAGEMINGKVSLTARVTGAVADPKIEGQIAARTSYGKIDFPLANGTFEADKKGFSADANFASGNIHFRSNFDDTKRKNELELIHVSLGEIAHVNGWKNVQGLLDARTHFGVSNETPFVDGQMTMDGFHWGRFKAKQQVRGQFRMDDKGVSLTSQAIQLKAVIKPDQVRFDSVQLLLGKTGKISAKGTLRRDDKSLDFTINGSNVPPDAWPPLVARYPAITGSLNMDGNVSGTVDSPEMDVALVFQDLRFLQRGGIWNGSAQLKTSARKIELNDVKTTAGYQGRVALALGDDNGPITVDSHFRDADPQFLFDVFKSTLSAAGELSGDVQMVARGASMTGSSTFTWVNGKIEEFMFDKTEITAVMTSGTINVQNFSLVQGPRLISGSGEFKHRDGAWDYVSTLQLQNVGTLAYAVDGEARISGRFKGMNAPFEVALQSPILWVNQVALENVSAKVVGKGRQWALDANAQPNIKAHIDYNAENDHIDGTLKADSIDWETLLVGKTLEAKNKPQGQVALVARIKGLLYEPEITVDLGTDKTHWRNEDIEGNVSVKVDGAILAIREANVRLRGGGTFNGKGTVVVSAEPTIRFNGRAEKVKTQSVFHLLEWPVQFDATADADFQMNWSTSVRQTVIDFKGRHEGWGAFSEGGKISGRIVETNQQWDLSGVRVESGSGFVVVLPGSQVFVDKSGTVVTHVIADTRNLHAGLLTFFGQAEVRGMFHPTPGSLTPPPVELDVFAHDLWINQFALEGNITHLTIRKGELEFSPIPGSGQQLSGVMDYADYPTLHMKQFRLVDQGTEKIYLDGFLGPQKWDYDLNVKRIDAGVVRSLFDTTFPINGLLDANVKGQGNLKAPILTGDVTWENGHVDAVPVDNATAKFSFQNKWLNIKEIRAVKKRGYQLTGQLKFYVDPEAEEVPDPEIDLVIDKGDLTMLQEMWPDVTKARGNFSARFKMQTKPSGRSVSGYVGAQKVILTSAYTPHLYKGELAVRLDKNRFYVDEAHAHMGNGEIRLAGYIDFQNGRPNYYNLSLQTQGKDGVEIRVPELSISAGPLLGQFGVFKRRLAGSSRGEPLINLILKGPTEEPLLAGTIELENTVFTYPPTKTAGSSKAGPVGHWFMDFWEKLKLDVSVLAGRRTWYQNELVDANVTGSIRFSGPTTDLDIDGKINTEQGSIVYSGSEFKIREATIELDTDRPSLRPNDPKQTFVYLKATAEKQVYYADALSNSNQDTIVMVVDRSLLGEIQPRFYSRFNPSLPSERALQLALGLPMNYSVDSNSLLPDQRASASQEAQKEDTDKLLRLGLVQLLDSNLASPLARAIARNTGLVDVIRISYQEPDPSDQYEVPVGDQASQNNVTQNEFLKYARGTRVKVGRGLSKKLFADYSVRVDEFENQLNFRHEVELSYQLKRNLFLRGVSELDNERELGRAPDRRAILENQWRFGLPKSKKLPDPQPSPNR